MIKDINHIFKEKHIELEIESLGRLFEINWLLHKDFSNIIFKYTYNSSIEIEEFSISEIVDNLNWFNLKFAKIYNPYELSPDEFQFWWKMLRSSKTRFKLTDLRLKLRFLSECLTLLSLCSECPELKFVYLGYLVADAWNADKIIMQAKREFCQKFGFIQNLKIYQYSKS